MPTIMTRRISSTPVRSVAETWNVILSIIAPDASGSARRELNAATGVACAAISSEATKIAPILVINGGLTVRIYCNFGEDAISGDLVDESNLPLVPTEGNWKVSIPVLNEDVSWSETFLAGTVQRVSVRSQEDAFEGDTTDTTVGGRAFDINLDEFSKP
jgi:hypothetical protein